MFPDRDITVIDSLNLSMAQGFMALTAARAAQAGATPAEISVAVEDSARRLHVYALLPTLKYVAMSGRVGKFVAGVASTLDIMPILTVREGKLELLERKRTHRKALDRLLELVQAAVEGKKIEAAALIHVNNFAGARELEKEFRGCTGYTGELVFADFTPGLSVHAGPGVVGLVILEES
jgi:DegV family protein with EDD domain